MTNIQIPTNGTNGTQLDHNATQSHGVVTKHQEIDARRKKKQAKNYVDEKLATAPRRDLEDRWSLDRLSDVQSS